MSDRACVAILNEGKILMVRQTYRGSTFWTFPGGSIEPDETPQQAAIREVKEEVGLDVELLRMLRQCSRSTSNGTYFCYLGRITGGNLTLADNDQELHDVQWFRLNEVHTHPEVDPIWPGLPHCVSLFIRADERSIQ